MATGKLHAAIAAGGDSDAQIATLVKAIRDHVCTSVSEVMGEATSIILKLLGEDKAKYTGTTTALIEAALGGVTDAAQATLKTSAGLVGTAYASLEIETHVKQHKQAALPPTLEAFKPLSKLPETMTATAGLDEHERALFRDPTNPAMAVALADSLKPVITAYEEAITARLSEANLVETCDTVIDVGNRDFSEVYHSVFGVIKGAEAAGIDRYQAAVTVMRALIIQDKCKQAHSQVVPLYVEAAMVHPAFGALVKEVRAGVAGSELSFDEGGMKKTSRMIEKAWLRPDEVGNVDRVCDVVRAMITVGSMAEVAAVVEAFTALATSEGKVGIVRIKERFFEVVSPGGWRDLVSGTLTL